MKKIVAVAYGARQGGGSFQYASAILETLSQLPKEDYDVSFFYTSRDWEDVLARLGMKARFVPIGGFAFRLVRKLLKIWLAFFPQSRLAKFTTIDEVKAQIFRMRPDVCICLNQEYIPVSGRTKLIAPIHDIMHRYESRFPEVGAVQEYVDREFVARHLVAEASVLVDSNIGKMQLIECYNSTPERIHVLPFIASVFLAGDATRPSGLNMGADVPFIFYPAQFWPHKNHIALLQALTLLHKELNVHAVFVGAVDKEGFRAIDDYIALHALKDRVHVLGYVSDAEVQWLYQHAACLVMPSFFGPTNIPPLEAIQCGCPVATSKIYGNIEQLGDAALFFDPHNPEELAHCITLIMTDKKVRAALIEAGYTLSRKWNASAFKNKFRTILLEIICK